MASASSAPSGVQVVIEDTEASEQSGGNDDGLDEVDSSGDKIPNVHCNSVSPYLCNSSNTKFSDLKSNASSESAVNERKAFDDKISGDSRSVDERGEVNDSNVSLNDIKIDFGDGRKLSTGLNLKEDIGLAKEYRKFSDDSIGSIISTISGEGLISTEFTYDDVPKSFEKSSVNARAPSNGTLSHRDKEELFLSYDDAPPHTSVNTAPSFSLNVDSIDIYADSDRNAEEECSKSSISATGSEALSSEGAADTLFQLSAPEEEVEIRHHFERRNKQKVRRSGPLLAPPPRFPLDDDEDDHAWEDFTDASNYFECPELLESYRALRPRLSYRKAINNEVEIQCENGEKLVLRSTCDWSETAVNGDHLWCPTSASGDFCYVGEEFCCKNGPRMKCSACKIIAHKHCIPTLGGRVKFTCKPSFRDVGLRQYREQTATHHHWVHRRNQKGKCKACNKGFQGKLLFGSKEIVAISCSWCKQAYHNREGCFAIPKLEETCSLGLHHSIIVPPSWIVKLPRRGSFKSSLRKNPKKRASKKNKSRERSEKDVRTFAIKPIPNANIKPVIVFINPKSGGNQGAKLMQKFQWLLNPRQVFDLTEGGPRAGMEMFRKVSQLRVLACGGDGTVGWVLSVLDQMAIDPPPAVAVLPLGTGNDLARALGWGGGYTDEPISKILCNISDGEIIHLDRWKLDVRKNPDAEPNEEGKDAPPLTVVNNYFSFGVDAHIALEFHEAREANPQKFNSRLRNKMFYGQAGGKDLLQRRWKDLCEMCTLECDGKDLTPLLKEHRVHAIVFLNIPSYGSGTHPWNRSFGSEQRTDDGKIEVLGLTTYQMPLLQAGGHGTCLTQCTTARIVTTKTIPMQVDGEACRVNPAIIEISHLNKAPMVTKMKAKSNGARTLEQIHLKVAKLGMRDYTQHHYDKEKLKLAALPLFELNLDQDSDLQHVRQALNKKISESGTEPLSDNWCFLDSCTAERFFRIDHGQEHLHYVTDICTDELFLLNPEEDPAQAAEVATSDASPQQRSAASTAPDSTTAATTRPADGVVPSVVRTDVSNLLEKHTESLIKAAKLGDLKAVKEIHNAGYSLLSIDAVGMTALHHSAKLGHKDIVHYLIASAPQSLLDMTDTEKGQSALHMAAANGRRNVCCMLVAAGASLSIKDLQGQTPQALARRAEDDELAQYLESQALCRALSPEDVETTV